jgi:protein SCO1/2
MPRKLVKAGIALIALVILAGIVFNFLPREQNFHLQDNKGREFTAQNLQGQWSLVFFGFTHCPMMCPLTMSALQEMYLTLEHILPHDRLPQVILITLDPERDTQKRLNEYINAFNPRFIGLTGDKNVITSLMGRFHIIAVKMQPAGADNRYTLNHGGEILVFNPKGKMIASWPFPHRSSDLVNHYKAVVQGA